MMDLIYSVELAVTVGSLGKFGPSECPGECHTVLFWSLML